MNQIAQAVVVLFAAVIIPMGCITTTSDQSEVKLNSSAPTSFVKCIGKFVEYEDEYSWFDNWTDLDGSEVHDDGISPRAIFLLSSPKIYAGRQVAVLFKYEGKDLALPPNVSKKGRTFSFSVPADFLTGQYVNIDNIHVEDFEIVP